MALLATFGFSLAPPVAKGAINNGMDTITLLTIRMAIASLLLGSTLVLTASNRLSIDRRGLFICCVAGLANGIGMITFFLALTRIQASIGSMLFSLSPLVVLGLIAIQGEKLTRRHIVRLIDLLIGPGSVPGSRVDWLGVALVMATNFTFAIHLTLIQWSLQAYDARTVTFYVVVVMAVVAAAFWLWRGAEWRDPGPSGWLAIMTLVVVCTYLARLALFAGVRSLGSGQMALLAPLETLLTVIWSVLFLHERLTFWQWIGGAFILASALLAVRRLNRARWPPRWRTWARP
jgi:drug/metabolite transporter (DMT)-like permease